jgi:hypothetical protein
MIFGWSAHLLVIDMMGSYAGRGTKKSIFVPGTQVSLFTISFSYCQIVNQSFWDGKLVLTLSAGMFLEDIFLVYSFVYCCCCC